jgi:hypothetical protein
MALETLVEIRLGSPLGQLRAAPVCLGSGAPRAFLVVYGADYDVDPWVEMFFFPTDTLKIAVCTAEGQILWRRDLGRGVVPGSWFCPVFPFDLDGDGVDEIWFVNNPDPDHPLGLSHYRLERLDSRTGDTTGHWPWPRSGGDQSLSHTFRNFILGGSAHGAPVLVTAQGTYGSMFLQGWRPDMSPRWEHRIPADVPGARGSHMCPVTDLDGDGSWEVMWGERCIELDTGTERFCADRELYRGHSDIVQPLYDREADRWLLYTCRESDPDASPRVVLFDAQGRRVWGAVDHGHIDMGWVARLGEEQRHVATAIRIGAKRSGPHGHAHEGREEFAFDASTGAPCSLPFDTYATVPVDLNGDGYHELIRGDYKADGLVLDRHGNTLGSVGGPIAMASRFLDHPGEQVLAFYPDGTVRVWGDRNAEDSEAALARYAHPFYTMNQRLSSSGANAGVLAGL